VHLPARHSSDFYPFNVPKAVHPGVVVRLSDGSEVRVPIEAVEKERRRKI